MYIYVCMYMYVCICMYMYVYVCIILYFNDYIIMYRKELTDSTNYYTNMKGRGRGSKRLAGSWAVWKGPLAKVVRGLSRGKPPMTSSNYTIYPINSYKISHTANSSSSKK